MEFNKEFDASGLACPLPIVKISTDPGSVCDMAAFAEQTGHALLQQGEEAGKFVFFIKKA
ncbi:MAG: sulfurtransferase TusA family protein [Polaromonas sp.]|nr:sulfurtransferase TusA family protein [Polaromonas sp.]